MSFLLADALSTTSALTDNNGALTATYTYAPFGQTVIGGAASPNTFQFTARENDGTGLLFCRARYYDPVASRFISPDPIGLNGGVNYYSYASNNPLRYADPFGLVTFGLGGQASYGVGTGGSVSVLGVADLQGNLGAAETVAVGGLAGWGYSLGGQFQVTTATEIGQLTQWSVITGGSVTIAFVNVGVEWIVGQNNRYHGLNVNIGVGGGPLAAEFHTFAGYTWVQQFFNAKAARQKLVADVDVFAKRIQPSIPGRK